MISWKWIALAAPVVVAVAFYAGVLASNSVNQKIIDSANERADEYERGYNSLERRDVEWHNAFHKGFTPNPPKRYVPFAGRVP